MHDEQRLQVHDSAADFGTENGGAGLLPRPAHDPFPRWAGLVAGLTALVFTAAVGGTLYSLNPSFQAGTALGAADQVGPTPAIAADAASEAGTDTAEAKRLIGQKGCGACHIVPGLATAKGQVGPNLAGVGARKKIAAGAVSNNGVEDLAKWIENAPGLKPGTVMPKIDVTIEEATTIAKYLETLK